MPGELIGEERGKITGTRVTSVTDEGEVETSFATTGQLMGTTRRENGREERFGSGFLSPDETMTWESCSK